MRVDRKSSGWLIEKKLKRVPATVIVVVVIRNIGCIGTSVD